MIKFLLNKKFWAPIIVLLVFFILSEYLLSFGYWDKLIKPKSYLGNAIHREKAVKAFGLEKIDWITVGDSRFDWGINHGKLRKERMKAGENVLRMSFEGADYFSMQATVNWSIENMPNLKGVLIGVNKSSFINSTVSERSLLVAWPFLNDSDLVLYQSMSMKKNLKRYFYSFAWFAFFNDIKDFLKDPFLRVEKLKKHSYSSHLDTLDYNRNRTQNTCKYDLSSMETCVMEANRLKNKDTKLTYVDRLIIRACEKGSNQARLQGPVKYLPKAKKLTVRNNWNDLVNSTTSKGVAIKFVILPSHSMFTYRLGTLEDFDFMMDVLKSFKSNTKVEVHDLSQSFSEAKGGECEYYKDPTHYSNLGKTVLTQNLIIKLGQSG
ncbi:hypothetical protein [Marinicella rhabdoformis]|uniref:hypothetical protein n=1 Tax=Marinicella rhabdoformis TaxID=2580566 RepID=UPI0012AEB284|nr:hypothetical protein [Marinicella rhabdoformis]